MGKHLVDITKKSGIIIFGGLLGAGLNLIFNFIATRTIGAHLYGQFIYIYTVITFCPLICTMGLDKALIYFIPKMTVNNQIDERNRLITSSFVIVFVISLCASLVLFLGSGYISTTILHHNGLAGVLRMSAILAVLLTFVQMSNPIFRSIGNISIFVRSQNVIVPVLKIVSIGICVLAGFTAYGLTGAFFVALSGSSIFLFARMRRLGLFTRDTFRHIRIGKETFAFALPMLFSGVIGYFSRKIDIVFIGHFNAVDKVAVYNIAVQIGTMTNFAMMAFNSMFAPVITSLFYKGETGTLSNLYKTITKWMVVMNLIGVALILLFSHDILRIFGDDFTAGSTALIMIAIGQVFNVGVGSAGLINTMTGHPNYTFYVSIYAAVVNIVLNYFLVPVYGINGAAFASMATIASMNLIKLSLVYWNLKIHPYDWSYLKVLLAVCTGFGVIFFLKNIFAFNWFVQLVVYSILFVAIFSGVLIAMGLSPDDRLLIDKFLKKIRLRPGASEPVDAGMEEGE